MSPPQTPAEGPFSPPIHSSLPFLSSLRPFSSYFPAAKRFLLRYGLKRKQFMGLLIYLDQWHSKITTADKFVNNNSLTTLHLGPFRALSASSPPSLPRSRFGGEVVSTSPAVSFLFHLCTVQHDARNLWCSHGTRHCRASRSSTTHTSPHTSCDSSSAAAAAPHCYISLCGPYCCCADR